MKDKLLFDPGEFLPAFHALIETDGLDASRLSVALRANEAGQLTIPDRQEIIVYDGKKPAF